MTLAQRESLQAVRKEWQVHLRSNAPLFRSNEAPRQQLHFLASIYFGHSTWAVGDSSQERLCEFLEDDELVSIALNALMRVPGRPDLPSVEEAFELSARNRMPFLALPLLAGLEEGLTQVAKIEEQLHDDLLRQALTIHALYEPPSHQVLEWRQWAVTHRPQLVAETVVAVYRAALRSNRSLLYGLYELARDPAYEEVARLSVPSLLRSYPMRVRADQLGALTLVLAVALVHCDVDEFCTIVDSKLAAKSMGAQQRMHWMCAGVLRRPATYLPSLKRELERGANQRRARYAGEFLDSDDINRHLVRLDHIEAVGLLIRSVGAAWGPFPVRYPVVGTSPGETVVPKLIDITAKRPDASATTMLQGLGQDPALVRWHERLRRAARDQGNLRRNAEFRYPPVYAVMDSLARKAPANAGDLAALAYDELATLGREIRDGQTSDWRQYWRTECDPWLPQRENDGRDRLLSDLRPRLRRFDVAADKEPSYADEKRADIRVSYDSFNVPIEIKLSSSKDLWGAIRNQLIPRYARGPGAAGHGILLVFWFGQQFCRPKAGKRPASAAELQASLVDSLPPDVSRLVKVLVIDVERPQEQPS